MQLVGIQIYNLDIARIKKQYKEMKYYQMFCMLYFHIITHKCSVVRLTILCVFCSAGCNLPHCYHLSASSLNANTNSNKMIFLMLTNRMGKLYNILQDPDVLLCFCCQKKCKNSVLNSNLYIDIYQQSLALTEFSLLQMMSWVGG